MVLTMSANAELKKGVTSGMEGAREVQTTFRPTQKMRMAAQQVHQGMTIETVGPFVAPDYRSSEWEMFKLNVMNHIRNGASSASLQVAAPLQPEYLMAPTSGEGAKRVIFPAVIKSSTPFSLSELEARIEESTVENYLGQSFTYGGFAYSDQVYGWYWGPDQIMGNADDVVRASGSPDQPVNALYFLGVGAAYTADSENTKQMIRDHMAKNHPFSVIVTYKIRRNGVDLATGTSAATTLPPSNVPNPHMRIVRGANGQVSIILEHGVGEYDIETSSTLNSAGSWKRIGSTVSGVPFNTTNVGHHALFRAVRR